MHSVDESQCLYIQTQIGLTIRGQGVFINRLSLIISLSFFIFMTSVIIDVILLFSLHCDAIFRLIYNNSIEKDQLLISL